MQCSQPIHSNKGIVGGSVDPKHNLSDSLPRIPVVDPFTPSSVHPSIHPGIASTINQKTTELVGCLSTLRPCPTCVFSRLPCLNAGAMLCFETPPAHAPLRCPLVSSIILSKNGRKRTQLQPEGLPLRPSHDHALVIAAVLVVATEEPTLLVHYRITASLNPQDHHRLPSSR